MTAEPSSLKEIRASRPPNRMRRRADARASRWSARTRAPRGNAPAPARSRVRNHRIHRRPSRGCPQPATIAIVGFGGDVDGVWSRAAAGCAEGVREAGARAVPGASSKQADAFIIGTLTAKKEPSGTFARSAEARLVHTRSRKSIRIVLVKDRHDDGFATGVDACRKVVFGRDGRENQ